MKTMQRPGAPGPRTPGPAPKPMAPASQGRSGQGADSALEHLLNDRKAKADGGSGKRPRGRR